MSCSTDLVQKSHRNSVDLEGEEAPNSCVCSKQHELMALPRPNGEQLPLHQVVKLFELMWPRWAFKTGLASNLSFDSLFSPAMKGISPSPHLLEHMIDR